MFFYQIMTKLYRWVTRWMQMLSKLLTHYSHVLSSCDSVSDPYKRGKKRASNIALQYVGQCLYVNVNALFFNDPEHIDDSTSEASRAFIGPTMCTFICLRQQRPTFITADRRCILLPCSSSSSSYTHVSHVPAGHYLQPCPSSTRGVWSLGRPWKTTPKFEA